MSKEEEAKLAFLRWLSSISDEPWLSRRPAAVALWEAIVDLIPRMNFDKDDGARLADLADALSKDPGTKLVAAAPALLEAARDALCSIATSKELDWNEKFGETLNRLCEAVASAEQGDAYGFDPYTAPGDGPPESETAEAKLKIIKVPDKTTRH